MNYSHPTAQARADAARVAPFWPFAPLQPHQHRQRSALEAALRAGAVAAAALALAACGGGDVEDDERASINPPACATQPQGCA